MGENSMYVISLREPNRKSKSRTRPHAMRSRDPFVACIKQAGCLSLANKAVQLGSR
jgi:hypothetical protein